MTLGDFVDCPAREAELVQIALLLGARRVRGWSQAEQLLAKTAAGVPRQVVSDFRRRIEAGEDPPFSRRSTADRIRQNASPSERSHRV
ncbi:MAG: hypothetical protein WD278_14750 [Pirellulales bacterium]